jgi:hypothetical protein
VIALSEPLRKTLSMLAPVLQQAEGDWWIISSAAVALLGARPVQVNDVDILTSVADARRILAGLGVDAAPGAASPLFRSDLFGTWHAPPLAAEFMAGFHIRAGSAWVEIVPRTRVAVRVAGDTLFTPSAAEMIDMLERFGRPKDRARADLLRQSLNG